MRERKTKRQRMTYLSVRVPVDVLARLDSLADRYDRTRSAVARRLLLRELQRVVDRDPDREVQREAA